MAIRFDTAGERLEITASTPSQTLFTGMLWLYIVTDTNAYADIITRGTTNWAGLALNADGVTLQIGDAALDHLGSALTVGQWNHVCWTHNGTVDNAFLNGVLNVGPFDLAEASGAPGNMYFGQNPTGSSVLNGRIAAIKVWEAELTAAEIAQEMRQYVPVRTANLYLFVPALTHTDITDYSGVGHTPTAVGTHSTEDGPPIPWRRGPNRIFIPTTVIVPSANPTMRPNFMGSD